MSNDREPEASDESRALPTDRAAGARAVAAAKRAAGTIKPAERLDPIARAASKPKNHRLAVIAKCWECAGAGQDGIAHTKETIRTCTVACPLRMLRPYQKDTPWLKSAAGDLTGAV